MNAPNDNAQKVPTNNAKGLDLLAVLDAAAYAAEKHVAGSRLVAQSERDEPRSHPHVAELYEARAAVADLIAAAKLASATLGNAYHTVLTGELAEHAHADYQRLDAALRQVEGK